MATTLTARPTSWGRTSPANQRGGSAGRVATGLGRYDGELTHRIHEHDANVTEMLELERQLLLELVQAVLGCEILHGRGDEALSNFERGFDFDAGRGARVDDGDDPGEKRRNKIDGAYGD